ncbi:MAG: helix-turn-helix domain-containing protein, partial [Flavobacteriales bacterium]
MYLSQNIKTLRKEKALTQAQFADKIGVKRSVIGAYEEGRSEPKLGLLQDICRYFKVSIDEILTKDLEKNEPSASISGSKLRVLPIIVDRVTDEEQTPLVPVKVSAGYALGYGDADYIGELPHFNLPFTELAGKKSYRVFQIEGDSMLPIASGSYVICEYIQDWKAIRDNHCYVVVTQEDGVVYKRLENHINDKKQIKLTSDNAEYEPYYLNINQVVEVW